MDKDVSIKILYMMIKRYGFDTLIAEFCNGVEVIESNDFYESTMKLIESENRRERITQCKNQFEYIDATIIMAQEINRNAYILLKDDLGLEAIIRKTIHEFVHLIHRCVITKKMLLNNLYEIEDTKDWKFYYYLDEFLTKKKEIIIYYDLLYKNNKIAADDVYINAMAKQFELAKESSNILEFMRVELFAIAETMAYQQIFTTMFPVNFIKNYAYISDISRIIEILGKFESIDVFINNTDELKTVIEMIERNF